MTHVPPRVTTRRTRVSRAVDGSWTRSYLAAYEHLVGRDEAGPASHLSGCPQCDGDDGLEARDQLGAIIARGGRRGRRVADAVTVLDAQFRRATVPAPRGGDGRWWHARYLD